MLLDSAVARAPQPPLLSSPTPTSSSPIHPAANALHRSSNNPPPPIAATLPVLPPPALYPLRAPSAREQGVAVPIGWHTLCGSDDDRLVAG
uniref:Uncharacterized protein n=1 Tax=Oryza barthii TaxID=65489 RepID=A0A0D3GRD3_9ORYZ